MALNTLGGMGFQCKQDFKILSWVDIDFKLADSEFIDNIIGTNFANSNAGQRQQQISQQPDNMNPAPVVINNSSTDTSAVQQASAANNGSANQHPICSKWEPFEFPFVIFSTSV